MASYKIKEGMALNLLTGSRKKNDKKLIRYEGGQSVDLSSEQALSHASVLEFKEGQIEKLEKAAEEPAPKKK